MNKKITDMLYRSFDGELSAEDQKILDQALASHPGLRDEKEKIKTMRKLIKTASDSDFSPEFSGRVMAAISTPGPVEENLEQSLIVSFRRISLAAAVVLLALMAVNLVRSNEFSLAGAFAVSPDPLVQLVQSEFPYLEEVATCNYTSSQP